MDYVNVNVLVVIVLLNFTKRGNGTKYKGIIISYDCILIYNYFQRNFSFKKLMPGPQTIGWRKNNNVENMSQT